MGGADLYKNVNADIPLQSINIHCRLCSVLFFGAIFERTRTECEMREISISWQSLSLFAILPDYISGMRIYAIIIIAKPVINMNSGIQLFFNSS